MGGYVGVCCVTGMPLAEGDKVVGIYSLDTELNMPEDGGSNQLLIGMPVRGTYDGYGSMLNTNAVLKQHALVEQALAAKGWISLRATPISCSSKPVQWVQTRLGDLGILKLQLQQIYEELEDTAKEPLDYAAISERLNTLGHCLVEYSSKEKISVEKLQQVLLLEAKKLFTDLTAEHLKTLFFWPNSIVISSRWSLIAADVYDCMVAEAAQHYQSALTEALPRVLSDVEVWQKGEKWMRHHYVKDAAAMGFTATSRLYGEVAVPFLSWYVGGLSLAEIRTEHEDAEFVEYALYQYAARVLEPNYGLNSSLRQQDDTVLRARVLSCATEVLNQKAKKIDLLAEWKKHY